MRWREFCVRVLLADDETEEGRGLQETEIEMILLPSVLILAPHMTSVGSFSLFSNLHLLPSYMINRRKMEVMCVPGELNLLLCCVREKRA